MTAILEATDTWAYNIDRGKINAVVFRDLKKVFGTVDHEILLSKLNLYGINGIAHQMVSVIFRGLHKNVFHQRSPL